MTAAVTGAVVSFCVAVVTMAGVIVARHEMQQRRAVREELLRQISDLTAENRELKLELARIRNVRTGW